MVSCYLRSYLRGPNQAKTNQSTDLYSMASSARNLSARTAGWEGLNERPSLCFSLPFCRVNIKQFTIIFVSLKYPYLALVMGVYATGHHGV